MSFLFYYMKFAIIKTGGKQYKVAEGRTMTFEKLPKKEGAAIIFSDVLLYSDGKQVKIGQPILKNVKVTGKLISQFKSKKVLVVKFKSKVRYRRTRGHRQEQSKVIIEKITLGK